MLTRYSKEIYASACLSETGAEPDPRDGRRGRAPCDGPRPFPRPKTKPRQIDCGCITRTHTTYARMHGDVIICFSRRKARRIHQQKERKRQSRAAGCTEFIHYWADETKDLGVVRVGLAMTIGDAGALLGRDQALGAFPDPTHCVRKWARAASSPRAAQVGPIVAQCDSQPVHVALHCNHWLYEPESG